MNIRHGCGGHLTLDDIIASARATVMTRFYLPPNAPQTPVASIVIPAYRSPSVRACLEALRVIEDDGVPFDVHVVLNDATEEVAQIVAAFAAEVAIIPVVANLGVAGGFNHGFSRTRGEFLVQLQDDAIVEPGWLRHLVERARTTPDAGAVGSLVIDDHGNVVDPGHIVWNDGLTIPALLDGSTNPAMYTEARSVDYHGSVGMLIRRSAWESVGGLDDAFYPAYYGDVDFCLRLQARGWRVLLEPRSRVMHPRHASTTLPYRMFLVQHNHTTFMERHASTIASHGLRAADTASIDRESRRAATVPVGDVPAPTTPHERATLEARLDRDPAEAWRRERDVRAAYACQLEAQNAELELTIDALSAREQQAHEQHTRQQANAQITLRQLRAIEEEYRDNQIWATGLNQRAQELDAVLGSRSWRLTAPLRSLTNAFRRRSN